MDIKNGLVNVIGFRIRGVKKCQKKTHVITKVKARFKVFPSAYAGGAIAKCRKVGAANYGNKSKKAVGGIMDKKAVIKAANGKAYRKRKNK